jgi:hypothetical protein
LSLHSCCTRTGTYVRCVGLPPLCSCVTFFIGHVPFVVAVFASFGTSVRLASSFSRSAMFAAPVNLRRGQWRTEMILTPRVLPHDNITVIRYDSAQRELKPWF